MGRDEEIGPEELRRQLIGFAEQLQRLDREGTLLERAPEIMREIGDLRARLFAYEVRATERLRLPASPPAPAPVEPQDAATPESRRIVEDAIRRREEAQQEWTGGWGSEEDSA